MINEPLLSPESCLEMQLSPPVAVEKACYNHSNNVLEAALRKTNEQEINLIEFETQGNETETWYCGTDCNCEILAGTKKYYFYANTPKSISIKINNCYIETKNIIDC